MTAREHGTSHCRYLNHMTVHSRNALIHLCKSAILSVYLFLLQCICTWLFNALKLVTIIKHEGQLIEVTAPTSSNVQQPISLKHKWMWGKWTKWPTSFPGGHKSQTLATIKCYMFFVFYFDSVDVFIWLDVADSSLRVTSLFTTVSNTGASMSYLNSETYERMWWG